MVWTRRMAPALALAGMIMLGSGCVSEGGRPWSDDTFTYVSTAWFPKTVSLLDTRTGETLWSVDVPVGQQLTASFRKGSGPNPFKPDMMDWTISEAGRGGSWMRNRIPVPDRHARRLEMTLRPAPEFAGAVPSVRPFDAEAEEYVPVSAATNGRVPRVVMDPVMPPEKTNGASTHEEEKPDGLPDPPEDDPMWFDEPDDGV